MDGKQLWQTTLGEMEVTMSKANYTTWLKNTSFLELNDEVLTIGVANIFTKEWLENKYHENIVKACRKIHPNLKNVYYKVATQQKITPNQNHTYPAKTAPTNHLSSSQIPTKKPTNRYTFENFIVGSNNRLAHAAALAVAQNPGNSYNPLFLYGGVGLGKTHLMQAVGNFIKKTHPEMNIVYCPSERFTNDLVSAIRQKKMNEFKNKYRQIDLLLIDDIQFIAGKEQSQEEFFHTFNDLHEHGKQIILSSDRPPRAIQTLEERLSSRFEWGMIADIQPPDLETRLAILEYKAGEANMSFDREIMAKIASAIQHNIRELEGALTRLIAHCQIYNEQPNMAIAEEILNSILQNPNRQTVTHKKILTVVSKYYQIPQSDIIGTKRNKEIVLPRQIAIYFMRKELSLSYPKIGGIMGGRDHTTIIHGYEKIAKNSSHDEDLSTDIVKIKEQLYME
jgi:chromosomal replication initiator protein